MTLIRETFWYKVYACDWCGEETDDPYVDDDGEDMCDQCADHLAACFAFIAGEGKIHELRARKRVVKDG